VIERHHGKLMSMENPTTTLEELFLNIVADSDERPGWRSPQSQKK
jgi:ABC-2 type transport system ATP-binding protein